MNEFDAKWRVFDERMKIVPGKELFSRLNRHLQDAYGISVSSNLVIESFGKRDICSKLATLLGRLNEMRQSTAENL